MTRSDREQISENMRIMFSAQNRAIKEFQESQMEINEGFLRMFEELDWYDVAGIKADCKREYAVKEAKATCAAMNTGTAACEEQESCGKCGKYTEYLEDA